MCLYKVVLILWVLYLSWGGGGVATGPPPQRKVQLLGNKGKPPESISETGGFPPC